MKKTITTILMILTYVIFIASFTILTIEIIFPNITIALSGIALPFAFITSIVIIVGTLVFLNKISMKEKKHNKANKTIFILNTIYFIISNIILFFLTFVLVIGVVVSAFWHKKNELELGFNSNYLISGDLYIGDIVNDTDIEIKFNGKVNLDNVEYLIFDNTDVKTLKINGNIIEVTKHESTDISEYKGICDYELDAYFEVDYGTVDGYRGYNLINSYNKNINIELSPNYMINVNDDLYDSSHLITDKGTPYQYRYMNAQMTARWILFIEYIINIPVFIYFGIYYSINSIKDLKKKDN